VFCPHCRRDSAAVRCPHCLETVDVRGVERVEQLAYLRNRLEGWTARGLFTRAATETAIAETEEELQVLHSRLGLLPVPAVPAFTPPRVEPASRPALSRVEPVTQPALPTREEVAPQQAPASDGLPAADVAEPRFQPPDAIPMQRQRQTPRRPPLTWRQIGLTLLSERTLNTLLLVGALLILASASVISTLNPTHLAPPAHLSALLATTAVFAAAGLALRRRLGLPRTGGALLAIAAVFLPLDVWTLGGAELLRWPPATTWLAASLFCLLAYLGAHLLLRDRAFALLSAAAGASLTLAAANRAGVATDWWSALLVLLAVLYVTLTPRARPRLPTLSWALRGTAHVLALGALTLFTLVSISALLGLTLVRATPGPLAVTWWLGTLFYALYARADGARYYRTVAASLSAVAALLTLQVTVQVASALGQWFAIAVAVLACLYGGYGYARYRRDGLLAAREALRRPPYHIAAALSVVALVWPRTASSTHAIGAALLAALYAYGTRRVRGLVPATVAVALLPVILADVVDAVRLPDPLLVWTLFALGALALAEYAVRQGLSSSMSTGVDLLGAPAAHRQGVDDEHVADGMFQGRRNAGAPRGFDAGQRVAAPLSRSQGERARPLDPQLGSEGLVSHGVGVRAPWRSPFTLPLLALGTATGLATLATCLARYAVAFVTTGLPARDDTVIAATALLTLGLLLPTLRRRVPALPHLAVLLAALPYLSLAVRIGDHLGWRDAYAGQAWALMTLALGYLGMASLLDSTKRKGAQFLYPAAYLCAPLAPALVLADRVTLSWLFGLALAACAWSAWLVATGRHRAFEVWLAALMPPEFRPGARALFGYLCAWLFPLWLLIAASTRVPALNAGAFGLALTFLDVAYLGAALLLARSDPDQARPWLSGGVMLAVVGPLLTLGDPIPRLAATALALVIYAAAAVLSRRPAWAYGVALALPALDYAVCDRLRVPYADYGLALLPVVLLLLGAGDELRARGLGRAWVRPFDHVAHGLLALLLPVAVPAVFLAGKDSRGTLALTALAYTLVLGVHASWRRRHISAWLATSAGLVGVQSLLLSWHVPAEGEPIRWAIAGLAVTLACALLRPPRREPWALPLRAARAAIALLTPLTAITLGAVLSATVAAHTFTVTIAIVGLQLATEGLANRRYRHPLIYGGIACEGVAYLVQLAQHGITQPQFYAVPVGLYLLGVAYVEWRTTTRHDVKDLLELAGLLIPLGASLLQALGLMTDGQPAALYDLVVMGEGIALLMLGVSLRWRKTLYAGATALVIDSGLIAYEPLRAVNTWYVVAIIGLAIIGVVVIIEKRRQRIVALADGWRRLQETWD